MPSGHGHVSQRGASSTIAGCHPGCSRAGAARVARKQPCGVEAAGLTRLQRARGRPWCSPALPRRGRDDPVVVLLQPLPQTLVGRWPNQLEAYRAQADVDVGQLARELAGGISTWTTVWPRCSNGPNTRVPPSATAVWSDPSRSGVQKPMCWTPSPRCSETRSTGSSCRGPARSARRRGPSLHARRRRCAGGCRAAARGGASARGEHPLIAVHDRVQVPHDDPDVKRHEVRWYAHVCSPSV